MLDEITDEDLSPRVGLSIRLGAGLGIVYTLLFVACLLNITNALLAAELAGVLLITLIATGYFYLNHRHEIIAFLDREKE